MLRAATALAVTTLVILPTACGSDYIRAPAPEVGPDTGGPTPDVRAYPADTYPPPDRDTATATETRTPPCRRSPPASGCPCAHGGRRQGVCVRGRYDDAGRCQPPANFEPDETTCDDRDNDCDGTTDEGCAAETVCRDGDCTITDIPVIGDDGTHVIFDLDCPDGTDRVIAWPVERAARDGDCWRVQCWHEGREVVERWCAQ